MHGQAVAAMKGHLWFIRRFGFLRWMFYENWRRKSERDFGRKFDPAIDGEPLLRAMDASEEQIELAKSQGLA